MIGGTSRLVLELLATPERDPDRWAGIEAFLNANGVTLLDEPAGTPPIVVRAVADVATDVVARLRELEGVGRVDVDARREIS